MPDAIVEVTLPHATPQVQAMVQLQRHSGMRPGEVVVMRTIDLDTSGLTEGQWVQVILF